MASLSDAFAEGAPPVTLASHTGPGGVTYSRVQGSGTLDINPSGQLSASSNENSTVYLASVVPSGTPQVITYTCVINNAGKGCMAAAGRMSATGQDCYFIGYYGGTWILYRRLGNAFTNIASWANSATGTFTVELTLGIGLQVGKINGTTRLTAADTSITAAGRFGLIAAVIDGFAQNYITSWSATDSSGTTYNLTLTASLALAAVVVRSVISTKFAALALTASRVLQARITRVASLALSAAVARLKAKLLTLTASIGLSSSVSRSVQIVRSAQVVASASVRRAVTLTRSAAISLSATAAASRARFLVLVANIGIQVGVAKAVSKVVAAQMSVSAAVSSIVSRFVAWVDGNPNVWRVLARARNWVVKRRDQ